MINIRVKYYAAMREERGKVEEIISTEASTVEELYDVLKEEYHLSLSKSILRVAINQEYQPWNSRLKDNDEVIFIPPVNGG